MKKLLGIAGLALLASAAFGQANLVTRVFTYDSTQATNGLSTFEVNNSTVYSSGTAGTSTSNAVTGASTSGASFAVNTTINVLTYVYLSGNLGGTFTINGPGTNTDIERDNDCEVRSNRPLTFTTSAFTVLQTGGASASTAGSVLYGMSVFTEYPAGSQVGSTQSGTDTAVNGKSVATTMSSLATDGKMTLRLARTLTLTQLAEGATTYTASGTIALAIN
jgi:hypothetical protein